MLRTVLIGALVAFLMPAAHADVEITYSKYINRMIPSIDRVEQLRENIFRRTANTERRNRGSVFTLNNSRLAGTVWAGPRLIKEIEDYGITRLAERLIEDNLERAGITPDGTVRLHIEKFRLQNSSVARLRGVNSYAAGEISLIAPDGSEIDSHKVRVNFVNRPTADRSYDGPDYAFIDTDEVNRIGPLLADLVEKGLEKLYPGHEDDFRGSRMVLFILSSPSSVFTVGPTGRLR